MTLAFGLSFVDPVSLWWAVLLVPVFVLMFWSLSGLYGPRRWVSLALRTALVLCLVGALAQAQYVRENDDLAVVFLVDRSKSVHPELQRQARTFVDEAVDDRRETDLAGMVILGGDAAVEEPVDDRWRISGQPIAGVVDRDHTDLAGAVRIAMASIPEGRAGRMVLLSDGLQTRGRLMEEVQNLRHQGIPLDVVPLERPPTTDREILVDKIVAPNTVNRHDPFDVKVVINASEAGPAEVTLRAVGRRMELAPFTTRVMLREGTNVFAFPYSLAEADNFTVQATVQPLDARGDAVPDAVPQNNEAYAYVLVRGGTRVLLVDGDWNPAQGDDGHTALSQALADEGIPVERVGVNGIPTSPGEWRAYDLVILADVPKYVLGNEQQRALRQAVWDAGVGLVTVGGPDSYGAGGYTDEDPLVRALPISLDVSQKKDLPSGALALIMHTCEFPQGNAWGKKISKAALNALSPQDEAGLLLFGAGGDQWLFPLQRLDNRAALIARINGMAPGDMPAFDPSLKKAYTALSASNAGLKHVLVITDGDPQPPTQSLVAKMKEARITVTVVVIQPHGGPGGGLQVPRQLATSTGGRFYHVQNANQLPRIFIKEAVIVRRSLIYEDPFTPVVHAWTDPLYAFDADTRWPTLRGYVTVSEKQPDEVDVPPQVPLYSNNNDPVLAHWNFGLGKTVSWMSDARNRWSKDWVAWGGYQKFWAGIARWAMRSHRHSDHRVTTEIRDGRAHVTVEAIRDGERLNFLDIQAHVTSPDHGAETLTLRPTAPGVYETSFDAAQTGGYWIHLRSRDPDGGVWMQDAGLAVSYSPEFRLLEPDRALLERAAAGTDGRVLALDKVSAARVFEHNLPPARTAEHIWPDLLWLAVVLLVMDVFVRRVVVGRGELETAWATVAAVPGRVLRRARPERGPSDPRMARLLQRKESVRRERTGTAEEDEGRPAATGKFEGSGADHGDVDEMLPTAGEGERRGAAARRAAKRGQGDTESRPRPAEKDERDDDSYTSRLLRAKKRALDKRDDKDE